MQDGLCIWRHGAPYNLHILGVFCLCLDSFYVNEFHHTKHISVFWCNLVPCSRKPWHLKHCWIEGVILNSSTLKIMPVFWHISPPEISASACFGKSHFSFIKGRSLPVLLDFILSASAWVILLKSSNFLNSFIVMLIDTPLNTKNLLLRRLQSDMTLVVTL